MSPGAPTDSRFTRVPLTADHYLPAARTAICFKTRSPQLCFPAPFY
jgi:hypothetical protein